MTVLDAGHDDTISRFVSIVYNDHSLCQSNQTWMANLASITCIALSLPLLRVLRT